MVERMLGGVSGLEEVGFGMVQVERAWRFCIGIFSAGRFEMRSYSFFGGFCFPDEKMRLRRVAVLISVENKETMWKE